jgi:hypothetical protein
MYPVNSPINCGDAVVSTVECTPVFPDLQEIGQKARG